MAAFHPDDDIPDLSGKVIFVTGGNVGLGKETVLQLSKHHPAHIYLAARSQQKANDAIAEIKETVPDSAPITFIELDLTSFQSVQQAANYFLARSEVLHILVNNAGIMSCPPACTAEGYEIQFGTNHMGHALLTKLLLPVMQRTAKQNQDVRVVTLSSAGEALSPSVPYDFSSLKTDMASYSTFRRYGISKVANIHHSRSLSRHYPEIRFIAIHPGVVKTTLSRGMVASYPFLGPVLRFVGPWISTNVADGARNQLWACVSPDAKSGEFYHPIGVVNKGSPQAQNCDHESQLWTWTEEQLEAYS